MDTLKNLSNLAYREIFVVVWRCCCHHHLGSGLFTPNGLIIRHNFLVVFVHVVG